MKTALILGAAVWRDGPSPTLRRRTLAGAALFHAGRVDLVIPCGGLGAHPPTEARAMADLLEDAGVPAARIRLEERSTNTSENIRFALPLLPGPEVTIVSDWYHLPRARLVARRAGLTPRLHPAPLRGTRALPQTTAALREVLAYGAYATGLRGRKDRP